MIIEFSVTNFRSIKNRQTLDFTMNGRVSKKELDENLILPIEKSHGRALLSSAIVFGANASGKSNFLKAIRYFLSMVEESQYNKLDKPIAAYEPFKLDNASKKLPITFEIDFIAKDKKRYIYTVAFSKFKIISEELFYYEAGKKKSIKSLLFSRDSASQVYFGESYRGKKDFALNPNQLLLSKAGVDALPSIVEAYRFFTKYSYYLDPLGNAVGSEALLRRRGCPRGALRSMFDVRCSMFDVRCSAPRSGIAARDACAESNGACGGLNVEHRTSNIEHRTQSPPPTPPPCEAELHPQSRSQAELGNECARWFIPYPSSRPRVRSLRTTGFFPPKSCRLAAAVAVSRHEPARDD